MTFFIIDTGYLNTERNLGSGGLLTSPRLNGGTALALPDTSSVALTEGVNVEVSPQPGSFLPVEPNYTGVENRVWTVSVSFDTKNSNHVSAFRHLIGVPGDATFHGMKTEGLKAIYVANNADPRLTVLHLVGRTTSAFHGEEIPTGRRAIVGYVKGGYSVTDSPGTPYVKRLSFQFVEA